MDTRELFLAAMKCALEGNVLQWEQDVSPEEWNTFFNIAEEHNVVPMVYESVYACNAFQKDARAMIPMLKPAVMNSVFMQVRRTEEFLDLYRGLTSEGLEPIVVKGIIVRMLHPNPDCRLSSDEDLYIPEGSYPIYKEALKRCGMTLAPWDVEKEQVNHEVSYISPTGLLKVEIHKDLFDSKLSAFKGMNDLFQDAFDRSILIDVDGRKIRTMNHSDHMLFLVLHAFKHFVTGGFGIRQVCDMVMYGNHYGQEIDWDYLMEKCQGINADTFAAAILDIGHRYLGFDYERSCYNKKWQSIEVDSEDLLNDLIDAGVFGSSSISRKHSANMTLSAVAAEKEGKKPTKGLLGTLFPPVEVLEGRFHYLQKHPFLLPVAWAQRILKYRKDSVNNPDNHNAVESMKIGNERVELMRKYGIIR